MRHLKNRRIGSMKLATLTGFVLLLTAGYAAAQSMTAKQCGEVWGKAVPKGDTLAEKDADPYIVDFKLADSDHDGTISKDEFKAACGKGLVKYTKP
jgi:EF hand